MVRKLIIEAISSLFIFLFVYAAVSKLMDIELFRTQIGQSPLLTAIAAWVAWIVPIIELIVAVLLTRTHFRLLGFYASFTLMIAFTAYIVVILRFTEFVPCSCGGVLETLGWDEHLIFNSAFVILGGLGIVMQTNSEKLHADYPNRNQIIQD